MSDTATVKIDGTQLQLPEDVCKTNKGLIDALAPFYPAAANADIKRETKDDKTVITVTKKAGTKGLSDAVVTSLDTAPESLSLILVIQANPGRRVGRAKFENALFQMLDDELAIARVAKDLDGAEPESSHSVPTGF